MGTIFRLFISAPVAALVTVVIFLALYNQISPSPLLYMTEEEDGKIYLGERVICVCNPPRVFIQIIIPTIPTASDNPWTNSEKVAKAPARQTSPDPQSGLGAEAAYGKTLVRCGADKSPSGDDGAMPIVRIAPPYPERCIKKGAEGPVTVRFDITEEGKTTNIAVIESADECLDAPAIMAISRWRYAPYCTRDGKPAMRRGVTEVITFEISD